MVISVPDPSRTLRRIAAAHGVVGFASLVSLILFFAFGGPLGTLNDVGNAALGLLSGVLAATFRRLDIASAGPGAVSVSAAILGAAATVVGSYLILSDTTGFFLAGLVSSAGFALIGLWLISLNTWIHSDAAHDWPRRLWSLGVVAGAVMMLGLIGVPGVAMGFDDMNAVPEWIHIGGLSWLGTYALFPAWSLRFGRAVTGPPQGPRAMPDGRHPAS